MGETMLVAKDIKTMPANTSDGNYALIQGAAFIYDHQRYLRTRDSTRAESCGVSAGDMLGRSHGVGNSLGSGPDGRDDV